jgi:hypothetical protein
MLMRYFFSPLKQADNLLRKSHLVFPNVCSSCANIKVGGDGILTCTGDGCREHRSRVWYFLGRWSPD